jgi:hypothetical protein
MNVYPYLIICIRFHNKDSVVVYVHYYLFIQKIFINYELSEN